MQQDDSSWLDQWEQIVSEVHTTDIPLECIKKIVFRLAGRRQRTININTLRRQGLDFEDMEMVLRKMFEELDDEIVDVEFVVDISAVAAIIQPETERLLGRL